MLPTRGRGRLWEEEGPSFLGDSIQARVASTTPGISESRESKHYYLILTVGKNNFSEDILVTEALNPSVFLTERNLNWQSVFRTEGLRFPEACVAFSCFGSPSKPGGQGARLGEAFSISADRVRAGEELLGSVASCPVQPQCE